MATACGDPLTGRSGAVKIRATRFDVTEWTAQEQIESEDFGDTSVAGKKCVIEGDLQLSGTVTARVKKTNWPFGASLNIRAGERVALELHMGTYGSGSQPITVPTAFIETVNVRSSRTAVEITFNFKSDGDYTYPTSAPS